MRTWILGLAGAAVFCALAGELTPRGMVKNVQKALCGVVMALALLGPLLDFDYSAYSLNLARYREQGESLSGRGEEISRELDRTIIEDGCETYILDKAQSLGLTLEGARVRLEWSGEGLWYPVAAELDGEYDEALSRALESELGIGREAQSWRSDEDD